MPAAGAREASPCRVSSRPFQMMSTRDEPGCALADPRTCARAVAIVLVSCILSLLGTFGTTNSPAAEPQWKSPRVRQAAGRGSATPMSSAIVAHLAQAAEDDGSTESEEDAASEDLPAPTPAPPRASVSRPAAQGTPQWLPDRGAGDGPPPADYGSMSGQFQPLPAEEHGDDPYGESAGYGDELEAGQFGGGFGFRPVRNAWSRFSAKHNVPLQGQSWRYRPYSLSGFVGGMFGDDMQDHHLEQQAAAIIGGRVGWDIDRYFGGEVRSWYSNPATKFRPATADQLEAHLFALDFDLLYYPWGETQLRPYLMAGLGFVDVVYHDQPTTKVDDMMLSIPFGIGVKYRLDNRFVLRGEFIDNYSLQGSVTDEMHNLAVTMGLEVRFGGGDRRSYYPWNPRLSAW